MGPLHLAETDDVATRYYEFLNNMIACFPIFGVVRGEALRQSNLHRSYSGSDRSLLAQLVLNGRFRQVDERLYVNRYHKSVGRLVPEEQQQAWMGSTRKSSGLPKLQQYMDLLGAPLAAGLETVDTVRCFGRRGGTTSPVARRGGHSGACCAPWPPWIAEASRASADWREDRAAIPRRDIEGARLEQLQNSPHGQPAPARPRPGPPRIHRAGSTFPPRFAAATEKRAN